MTNTLVGRIGLFIGAHLMFFVALGMLAGS